MEAENVVAFAGVGLCVAIVVVSLAYCIVGVTTERACLRAGWPNSSVTWNLERYCIKRVDQTDVVKPLSEIKP